MRCPTTQHNVTTNQPSASSDAIAILCKQLAASVFNAAHDTIGPVLDAKLISAAVTSWVNTHAQQRLRFEQLAGFVQQHPSVFNVDDPGVKNVILSYRVSTWMDRLAKMLAMPSVAAETAQALHKDYVEWFTDFTALCEDGPSAAAADTKWKDVMRLLKASPLFRAGGMLECIRSRHVAVVVCVYTLLCVHVKTFHALCTDVGTCQ